jgi:hypothetical protein
MISGRRSRIMPLPPPSTKKQKAMPRKPWPDDAAIAVVPRLGSASEIPFARDMMAD